MGERVPRVLVEVSLEPFYYWTYKGDLDFYGPIHVHGNSNGNGNKMQ